MQRLYYHIMQISLTYEPMNYGRPIYITLLTCSTCNKHSVTGLVITTEQPPYSATLLPSVATTSQDSRNADKNINSVHVDANGAAQQQQVNIRQSNTKVCQCTLNVTMESNNK